MNLYIELENTMTWVISDAYSICNGKRLSDTVTFNFVEDAIKNARSIGLSNERCEEIDMSSALTANPDVLSELDMRYIAVCYDRYGAEFMDKLMAEVEAIRRGKADE